MRSAPFLSAKGFCAKILSHSITGFNTSEQGGIYGVRLLESPVSRNEGGVCLLGTKWESPGKILFKISRNPSNAKCDE
jgi:hypothetical protein